MNASLEIEISSGYSSQQEAIELFNTDHWTNETELILMSHIHNLLGITRPLGKSINIHFNIEVTDTIAAAFMINKQKNKRAKDGCKLTERQKEILNLILHGYTTNEIAQRLFISFETVRSHRKHILIKMSARNTADLINHYYQSF